MACCKRHKAHIEAQCCIRQAGLAPSQHMLDIDMTARMPIWLRHTHSQFRTLWQCTAGEGACLDLKGCWGARRHMDAGANGQGLSAGHDGLQLKLQAVLAHRPQHVLQLPKPEAVLARLGIVHLIQQPLCTRHKML